MRTRRKKSLQSLFIAEVGADRLKTKCRLTGSLAKMPAPLIGVCIFSDEQIRYRKAILMCHPDKQKDAPPEQVYRADRIFNALSESWKNFDS